MTPRRLRVVFFGTGGLLSTACLRAIARDHDVAGVIRAARSSTLRRMASRVAERLGMGADPLTDAARTLGIRQWPVSSGRDSALPKRVKHARPDVICVAHFPWRLPDEVLGLAPRGGLNVHTSLLPRHRGPLPLFWVYHANDRETGITIHEMRSELDTGDIVGQESFRLERGHPVEALNAMNAHVAAPLLLEVLSAVASGTDRRQPQDERLATAAPRITRGKAMVEFDAWDAERVWHFLSGLWPRFVEPLVDEEGRATRYAGISGFERRKPTGQIGRVGIAANGRRALNCRDGVVWLA